MAQKRRRCRVHSSFSSRRFHRNKTTTTQPLCSSFHTWIRGLDESYLPRWIGYTFGSLLLLNHFIGSTSPSPTTPAQLILEVLGLSLVAFSIALPYMGAELGFFCRRGKLVNGVCLKMNSFGEKCAICLSKIEEGEEIRELKCSHLFHKDCIDRWPHDCATCPLCRRPTLDGDMVI